MAEFDKRRIYRDDDGDVYWWDGGGWWWYALSAGSTREPHRNRQWTMRRSGATPIAWIRGEEPSAPNADREFNKNVVYQDDDGDLWWWTTWLSGTSLDRRGAWVWQGAQDLAPFYGDAPHMAEKGLVPLAMVRNRGLFSGDPVHHPDHYTSGDVECIDAIRAALGEEGFRSYCLGNVLKYIWRAGKKGDFQEDLEKATVYLGWAKEGRDDA